MHNKLGLLSEASDRQANSHIINTWIDMLAVEKKDYSATFRSLCQFDISGDNQNLRDQFVHRKRFDEWAKHYTLALLKQVIDQAEVGNFEMFQQLLGALKKPYKAIDMYQKFSLPPPDWGKKLEICCSS